MKKSIFTLMALMATAVCGLTSCSDSDDDYVAPAGAAATVSLAGKTLVGDNGITIVFSDETNLVWKEFVNGTDDAQGTYTVAGTQLTMSLQMDPNDPTSVMPYNWTITMTSDSAGSVEDSDNGATFTFTLQD